MGPSILKLFVSDRRRSHLWRYNSADGNASGATLARFQVTGGPGSNMVFRPPNPIKVDVSHLIGGTIDQVKLMLVDQHGLQIDSLLGEKFSCVLVIESE